MITNVARIRVQDAGNYLPGTVDRPECRDVPRGRTMLSVLLLLTCFLLTSGIVYAVEFSAPEVFASVALQAELYSDGPPLLTSFGPGVNRYAVRYAALEAIGELGDHVEYNFEAGVATCKGSGQLMLMEGGVFYGFCPQVRVGLMKGHILRGFDLREECMGVLTAEKPVWALTFSPCHPTGAVCDFEFETEGNMAVEGQLAYLNGVKSTLDNEHDANIGLIFRTPLKGFSVAGFYNQVEMDLGYTDEWELIHGDGYRTGVGMDYQDHGAFLRAEFYAGRGFEKGVGMGENETSIDPEDHEMTAYYVEGAYKVPTGFKGAPYVQPYLRYQVWDRASNGPEDFECSYFTVGAKVGLGDEQCFLRLDYETPISTGEDVKEEANRLVIRLQTSL